MAAGHRDGASSINVTVRVRPFTIREAAQLRPSDDGPLFLGDGSMAGVSAPKHGAKGLRSVIKVVDEKCLVFDPPEDNPVQRFTRSYAPSGKRHKDQTFGFDRVFDDNTTQGDVYEATTKNLLDSVLDGYNATVFAYGATGCGKTHTITGTAQQPGIIFLTMQELFEKIGELATEKDSEVTLSYLEIYNETIRDLMVPGAGGKSGLMLREDASQAVSVAGLSSHKPQNVEQVMDMVILGNSNRTQSPTEANATSSRSHAVLQVNISLKSRDSSVNEPVTMATLSIIDLAGSERASATKNRGERLLEGANINKSLLALGSCINALCDPRKKNHVPYRNSKLTRLLKFSLGGNCRTVMIVCVSPSSQHFDETQNTLRYANRAKNIQTKSVRNVYNVDRHVKDYLKKIDEQMSRINELTAQQKQYEELAFVKFRKAELKRAEVAHEGVRRIRAAYEHAAEERRERGTDVRRKRQIERRIAALSGWIAAFDQVCESRGEGEEVAGGLAGMRRTARGVLVELEGSRQHLHQRLGKNNWMRAVETALGDGVRQLQGLEPGAAAAGEGGSAGASGGSTTSQEQAGLRREVELLKHRAESEGLAAALELDRLGGEQQAVMQALLAAHFETIATLAQILQMSEQDALVAAKAALGPLLQSCLQATGQVIKPDGGLVVTEAVAPTRSGTPRKRKQLPLLGPSPLKGKLRPSAPSALPPHVVAVDAHRATSSPLLSPAGAGTAGSSPVARAMQSPRRRIVRLGGARKGVAFASSGFAATPAKQAKLKKTPAKKRAVRWRDDAEEEGGLRLPLVEFQVEPEVVGSSPPVGEGCAELPGVSFAEGAAGDGVRDGDGEESPLSAAGVPSSELRRSAGAGRFAAGFLVAKRGEEGGSPAPPSVMSAPGLLGRRGGGSPLREIAGNRASSAVLQQQHTRVFEDGGAGGDAGGEGAGSTTGSEDGERGTGLMDRETAGKIRSAMKLKRNSSLGGGGYAASSSSASASARQHRHQRSRETSSSYNNNGHPVPSHRRRSPTASSASTQRDSPPPPPLPQPPTTQPPTTLSTDSGNGTGIFSASHARRMVKAIDRDDNGGRSVLSPRSQPVAKSNNSGPVPALHHRRSVIGGEAGGGGGAAALGGVGARALGVRSSSVVPGGAGRVSVAGAGAGLASGAVVGPGPGMGEGRGGGGSKAAWR
ncbi:hypothetical protein LTR08_007014 [Meristemomyces frigidus]|nr:hypothetical protein LTR08_007014 [Meristemomyces frigidus]